MGLALRGDHGCEVAEKEQQIMVAGSNDLMVPVKHSVKDGERQPADGKRHHTMDSSMTLILLASLDLYLLSLILSIMLFLLFKRMYIYKREKIKNSNGTIH